MYCKNCGKYNSDKNQICEQCESILSEPQSSQTQADQTYKAGQDTPQKSNVVLVIVVIVIAVIFSRMAIENDNNTNTRNYNACKFSYSVKET